MTRIGMLILSSLFLTGTAVAQEATLEDVPEGYVLTGESQSCLSNRQIDTIDPVSDRLWLVTLRNDDVYATVVSRGCQRADHFSTYLSRTVSGGSMCQNDIVDVVDRGTDLSSGSCTLGEFHELEIAGNDDHS